MSRGVTELGAKAVIQATELVTWKDLCEAAAKGEHFDAGGATLRGDLLSEWCRLPDPDRETRRLWIRNATIDGDLDLHDHEALFDIRFELCTFQGSLKLRGGHFKRIALLGCTVTGNFDAAEAKVDEGLTIARFDQPKQTKVEATVEGRLILHRIQVKGNLTLTGLQLTRACPNLPDSDNVDASVATRHLATFDLESAVVDGHLAMDFGFICSGMSWLPNATIGKQWDCSGAKFLHKGARCLCAQGIQVDRDCFFRAGFEAHGEVEMDSAQIGGQWICTGGMFLHKGTRCLFAQSIVVGEDCFIRRGFEANGEVDLNSAKIIGQWDCSGGEFRHQGVKCLYAQGIEVGDSCFLTNDFRAQGEVDLNGARIGRSLDCSGGKFLHAGAKCLYAQGIHIGSNCFLREGFEAYGEVDLNGAKIGGQWTCSGKFFHKGANCLYAQGIRVHSDCFLHGDFEAHGEVDLNGAEFGGQWSCAGGKFLSQGVRCLYAQRIRVVASCFLSEGFEAHGEVDMTSATIGGSWICTGGKFLHIGTKCLFAQGSHVGADCFLSRGFQALGMIDLNSAVFDGDVELAGLIASQPTGNANAIFGAPASISLWRATIKGTLDIEDLNCWGPVKLRELHVARDLRVVTSAIGVGSDQDVTISLGGGSEVLVPARPALDDDRVAFDADGIEVRGLFDFRPNDVRGKIDLTDAEFGIFCDHFGLPKGGGPAMSIQGHKPWGFVTEWFQYVRDLLRDTWTCLTRPRHFKALCSATHRPSHSQYKLNGVKVHSLHTECVHDARSIADWIRAADDGKFNGPLYLELAKLLSAKGHDEESRELNILKRVHQRQDLRTSVPKRVLDRVFFDFPIRYGYKPFFAIMNGLLCWFLLFVTSTLAVNNQMMAPASSDVLVVAAQKRDDAVMADRASAVANQSRQIRDLSDVEGISRAYDALDQPITASVMPFVPSGYPKFNPVIYAADRFVPLVDFGQAEMWVPDVSQKGGFWLMWFETAMILWGWILSTLLVASLTGLIKSEK